MARWQSPAGRRPGGGEWRPQTPAERRGLEAGKHNTRAGGKNEGKSSGINRETQKAGSHRRPADKWIRRRQIQIHFHWGPFFIADGCFLTQGFKKQQKWWYLEWSVVPVLICVMNLCLSIAYKRAMYLVFCSFPTKRGLFCGSLSL